MVKNYIKTAWRSLFRNKQYAFIHILGLTLGIGVCLLVGTVVLDDLSYDSFWSRKPDLYRILSVNTAAGVEGKEAMAFGGLGTELKSNFPEVEATAAVHTYDTQFRLQTADTESIPLHIIDADTNVWKLLNIPILEGDPQRYVAGQTNLIVSEKFQRTYFPQENPVGKTIYQVSAYSDEATPFLITGVMANIPANSYLRADAMAIRKRPYTPLNPKGGGYWVEQLLLMKPNTDMALFTDKANKWYRSFLDTVNVHTPSYEFQPIQDIYLKSDFAFQSVKGSMANLKIFTGIALLVLFIACINFVNLSTASAIKRLKESGVRKVLGAHRKQLVFQVLIESLLLFVISGLLASVSYLLLLGPLENYLGHSLSLQLFGNLRLFFLFLVGLLLFGSLTAAYPAWILSGSAVTLAIKNQVTHRSSGHLVRKTLVVVQFSMAILVLIGMMVVRGQVHFMENKNPGYNPDQLLNISQFSTGTSAQALKQELSKIPGIQAVSLAGWTPTQGEGNMTRQIPRPDHPDKQIRVNFMAGDSDMPKVLGLHLIQGRFFDKGDNQVSLSFGSFNKEKEDSSANKMRVLITENTASLFRIEHLEQTEKTLRVTPIGIVKDFHAISLRDPIHPTIVTVDDNPHHANILVKITPGKEKQVLSGISKVWHQFYPSRPLETNWVSDLWRKQYVEEEKQQQLFTWFSSIMLFLAALGVFGLIVHAAEQRVKEIGIRKVLGASVAGIVSLLSKDFVKLVLLAFIIASPLAWWAMSKWLQNFAYHIDIPWWMFSLAGCAAIFIALLTVSLKAVQAARANPVESLRNE